MPADTKYLGKERREWVKAAARALIQSMTPDGRYVMWRLGFIAFEKPARIKFQEFAGFQFTSGELRWIWEAIGRYMARREKHLHKAFERMYDADLRKSSPRHREEDAERGPITRDDIDVMNAQGKVH